MGSGLEFVTENIQIDVAFLRLLILGVVAPILLILYRFRVAGEVESQFRRHYEPHRTTSRFCQIVLMSLIVTASRKSRLHCAKANLRRSPRGWSRRGLGEHYGAELAFLGLGLGLIPLADFGSGNSVYSYYALGSGAIEVLYALGGFLLIAAAWYYVEFSVTKVPRGQSDSALPPGWHLRVLERLIGSPRTSALTRGRFYAALVVASGSAVLAASVLAAVGGRALL